MGKGRIYFWLSILAVSWTVRLWWGREHHGRRACEAELLVLWWSQCRKKRKGVYPSNAQSQWPVSSNQISVSTVLFHICILNCFTVVSAVDMKVFSPLIVDLFDVRLFFYLWISCFPSTINWGGCIFSYESGTIVKRQAAVAVSVGFWSFVLSHCSTRLILCQ